MTSQERLFIGINFDKETKNVLERVQKTLVKNNVEGILTHKDNFHVTIKYLGYIEKPVSYKLHALLPALIGQYKSFNMRIKNIDSFKKGKTHIVYADVQLNKPFHTLYNAIEAMCISLGVNPDTRPFNPHITLMKKAQIDDLSNIPFKHTITVKELTLFLSHRVDGLLTYTPLSTYTLL